MEEIKTSEIEADTGNAIDPNKKRRVSGPIDNFVQQTKPRTKSKKKANHILPQYRPYSILQTFNAHDDRFEGFEEYALLGKKILLTGRTLQN